MRVYFLLKILLNTEVFRILEAKMANQEVKVSSNYEKRQNF